MPSATIFYVSFAALWVLVIFNTLVLVETVRQRRFVGDAAMLSETTAEQGMLETGTLAPSFTLPDTRTDRPIDSENWRGRPTILVFVSPNCPYCEQVAEEIEEFQHAVRAQLVVLCRGEVAACADFATTHFPETISLVDKDGAVARRFLISRTPTSVLVDSEWHILRYGFPKATPQLGLATMLSESETEASSSATEEVVHSIDHRRR